MHVCAIRAPRGFAASRTGNSAVVQLLIVYKYDLLGITMKLMFVRAASRVVGHAID
jgi:hypothetical protein